MYESRHFEHLIARTIDRRLKKTAELQKKREVNVGRGLPLDRYVAQHIDDTMLARFLFGRGNYCIIETGTLTGKKQ